MPHVDELVHDQHDPILVVSLASGDLAATERDYATAQSLVSSCNACAQLHDDVLAIARATKALPPAARTRDFRITDADAATLRPAGWRRLVAGIANGPLFSRQLGVGLATLGIAGLLLTALPGIPLSMGSAGAAPAASQAAAAPEAPTYESLESQNDAAQVVPAPAASHEVDTMAGEPSQATGFYSGATDAGSAPAAGGGSTRAVSGPTSKPIDVNPTNADNALGTPASADETSSGGPSTIAIVSSVLLIAGLLLLLARRFTRGATAA
jgi:hypothetical protein